MPSKPMDLVLLISARDIPRPLSRTSRMTVPFRCLNSTLTWVAPACRMTLVSVSWKIRKKVVFNSGVRSVSCKLA